MTSLPGLVPYASDPGAGTRYVPATSPYPWPWDGQLAPSRLALVACGWSSGWRRATARTSGDVEDRVKHLATAVAAVGGLVVSVVPGRPTGVGGVEPGDPLETTVGHLVHSAGVDGFYGSGLESRLRTAGRDQLLLVGHGLEGPVHSTMRSANDRGLECLLVVDACGAVEPDLRRACVSSIEMSGGIFGAVGTTDAVVAALRTFHPGAST